MKDRQTHDGRIDRARRPQHDESWRGSDRTDEREHYEQRHHRRTSGFEPGSMADQSYDRGVDDRGYDRSRGAVGWQDRAARPEQREPGYGPTRCYAEPFERTARPRSDLHHRDYQGPYASSRDVPTRMMDDHPMSFAYRSPAERTGDGRQGFDGWRPDHWREDGWQRQARGLEDPGRHTQPSHEPFRGYEDDRTRGWRPDTSALYGVTGAGWSTREAQGKPPRGYTRTDERIREDICERMAHQGDDWSDVEVSVQNGEVTLTGRVEMRRQKYAAEHLSDGVRGVREIHNQIRVGAADSGPRDDASPAARTNGSDKQRRASS